MSAWVRMRYGRRWHGRSIAILRSSRTRRAGLPLATSICRPSALLCTVMVWMVVLTAFAHSLAVLAAVSDTEAGKVPVSTPSPIVFRPGEGEIVAIPELKGAAQELHDYVRQSTGLNLPIVAARTARAKAIRLEIAPVMGLAEDGFWRSSPSASELLLRARTAEGISNAVYDLLERDLGVRWLMPFPANAGTLVPKRPVLKIARGERRESPAYVNRFLTPPAVGVREVYLSWSRRMRFSPDVIPAGHNMHVLFPPGEFRRSNPEFYPVENGVRYPLESDVGTGNVSELYHWQPVVDAPGILEVAVSKVLAHFKSAPTSTWFSLGINDSIRWDDRLVRGKPPNSLGIPNVSDSYYRFVNKVVEETRKSYPDKYFGILAYHNTIDAPDFKLDDHAVPLITADRLQWVDKVRKEVDVTRTERWATSAKTFGLYDYVYGDGTVAGESEPFYSVPRIYPHTMAEYLRHGNTAGARYYIAEAYPSDAWTEGPKLYVLAKLLWDPKADVDALLRDWYESAVGKEAAPYLAKYFQFWETYWATRAINTSWFKLSKGPYLSLRDRSYVDALDVQDLAYLDDAMQNLVSRATGQEERARAAFLAAGYQVVRSRAFGDRFAFRNNLVASGYSSIFRDGFDGPGVSVLGWFPRPLGITSRLDPRTKFRGASSLNVSVPPSTGTPGYLFRSIDVDGKTSFCARIRARSTSDGFSLQLRLGEEPPVTQDHGATGAAWQTVVNCVRAAGEVKTALISLWAPEGAEVWFDEVELFAK